MMNEAEFIRKLREAFAIEADEHYRTISKCLNDLEHVSGEERRNVIELIFREAHSLKGAARAIDRSDIEALCQSLESLFSLWKKDADSATCEQFDLAAKAVDILLDMLESDIELSLNNEAVAGLFEAVKEVGRGNVAEYRDKKTPAPPAPLAESDPLHAAGTARVPDESVRETAALSSSPGERNTVAEASLIDDTQVTTNTPVLRNTPARSSTTGPDTATTPRTDVLSEERAQSVTDASQDALNLPDAESEGDGAVAFGTDTVTRTHGDAGVHPPEHAHYANDAVRAGGNGHAPAVGGTGTAVRAVKETIRVPIAELESLYHQTEELSSIKFMLGKHATDLRRVMDQCREWIREHQKQRQSALEAAEVRLSHVNERGQDTGRQETLENFLKWTARQIEGIESAVAKNLEDGRGTLYMMESMSDAMMDTAKQLLLMPFSIVTDPLPTIVRKLARDLNKEVRFHISGDEIRIDKRILEALKDPLLHLLRNSLDHGIEDPATRARHGKPVAGNLTLDIRMAQDNRIEIILEDDGRGIDIEKIKSKAVSEGLLSVEKVRTLSEQDALELVFQSGITTSPIITDVSGRGVGMNVVRENIVSMGGEIAISAEKDRSTVVKISLPLSLSNARGVLVRSQGRLYIVPLQFVERGIGMHRENFSRLEGKSVMEYEGRTVTVRRLEDILSGNGNGKRDEPPQATILMLRLTSQLLAVEVDEILWEQDVVIKPLPAPVSRIRTIAGATLLSNGELVLVLQVPDLFDAARAVNAPVRSEMQETEERKTMRLLVVDDSITSRVLLHDILIASGYEVKTAVDGIDALTHMREEQFDLIVSDVEMPRMNGFELTEAVRKDEKLQELPVILVTGLETQEHRERGFDVGANAYINKSSFDQSNLISVIERLL
ncbi:MAG: response regulator [Bacteroidetes bacterium]|nr:response regulator [Bacteroidota bacterium]